MGFFSSSSIRKQDFIPPNSLLSTKKTWQVFTQHPNRGKMIYFRTAGRSLSKMLRQTSATPSALAHIQSPSQYECWSRSSCDWPASIETDRPYGSHWFLVNWTITTLACDITTKRGCQSMGACRCLLNCSPHASRNRLAPHTGSCHPLAGVFDCSCTFYDFFIGHLVWGGQFPVFNPSFLQNPNAVSKNNRSIVIEKMQP